MKRLSAILLGILLLPCHVLGGEGEIPRGFVLPVEIGQGFRIQSSVNTPLYVAALRIEPMWSLLNNLLRLGATADVTYTNPQVDGLLGPRASIRLFQIVDKSMGEIMNTQMCFEALWGTRNRTLLTGGIIGEVDPILVLGLRAHWEYTQKEFWFEASVGLNIDFFFRHATDPFGAGDH